MNNVDKIFVGFGITTGILSILKFFKVIDWSWFWITGVFWIPVLAIFIFLGVYSIVSIYKANKNNQK